MLGVDDGLVTNLCVALGLAGASATPDAVRGVLTVIRDLRASPSSVERRMREEFVRNEHRPDSAARAARDVIGHQDGRLRVTSRALLGINPDEPGSPKAAAAWRGRRPSGARWWRPRWRPRSSAARCPAPCTAEVRGAVRQLVVLTAAAGVTFAPGRLVGTSLA
ncbi:MULTISPECIES: hypothetical protein [Streptomyces]|uniref:hypothetical protein n=1 Tax=Streptomyces TaxID=1883 RepID=UPI001487F2F8|nr:MULTISPECIES: hypothetical protein [Streptomyces]